jgi:N-acetyl-alpha-D-muramate 1-phosphate uridylyltransferase
MSLPVAILAGGLATRLRPLTDGLPKALVEVAGKPFAVHQIELLRDHGITEITLLVGHLGELVRDTLGEGRRFGVRLQYAFDGPAPLGTGGAIREALPLLGDRFFVLYGDSYLECNYAEVERAFLSSGKAGLMTVCRNDDRWDRSNVAFREGQILRYDKQQRTADMQHIDYGLGAFSRSAFADRGDAAAFDVANVYQDLLAASQLAAFEVPNRFYEIGSHAGLAETRNHLATKGQR